MTMHARFSRHPARSEVHTLRAGMVGLGMIFDETYRPFFEGAAERGIFDPRFGVVRAPLAALASRTGRRAQSYLEQRAELRRAQPEIDGPQAEAEQRGVGEPTAASDFDESDAADAAPDHPPIANFAEPDAVGRMLREAPLDFVCVAAPDDRHFEAARAVLSAGKHLLVEKPSVLSLAELDELESLARRHKVLAKVVYHKLLDPDHKKLRTLVADGLLSHVNNGYCSLLEPKAISGSQFAEWIHGRNPGTYVAVHYIKLIDFTFGGELASVACSGQRGLVGPADGPTWDSTQLRLVYRYTSGREAAFDIHTSWVTPDNFPGYVEQEVQFRFDNGVWNGHSRKRGVECTIEGRTPFEIKTSMNNHYNGQFLEPWGERSQRGYGIEVLERFVREVAYVEHGGPERQREQRLAEMRRLDYNDLAADRQTVAAVAAMEAILSRHAAGHPGAVVTVNHPRGGLVLWTPGQREEEVLYEPRV